MPGPRKYPSLLAKPLEISAHFRLRKLNYIDKMIELLQRVILARRVCSRNNKDTKAVSEWFDSGGWLEDLTLDEVASSLCMSRERLNSACKMLYGSSFLSKRNKSRVEESEKIIILHPEYSAQTVCMMCGFSDRRNFEHCFCQYNGKTPAQFRAAIRKKR